MNRKKTLLIGSAFAALVLVGCGGGSSTSASTGYLVDAAVANADYDCVADGNFNKTTGPDGSFTCTNMSQVRFRVGHLVLGEIHTLPSDKHVFPQDLVGVARTVNNDNVVAMAQLLQSLDSDGNPENGIAIAQESKIAVAETERAFNPADLTIYQDSASVAYRPTHVAAQQHLTQNIQAVANAGVNTGTAAANAGVNAGNAAANAGVNAGTAAANAGVNAGTAAANAGVNAGTAAANAGADAGNAAANAGINAGTAAANAGVNAGNAAANAGVNAGTAAANAGVDAGNAAANAAHGIVGI